MATDVAQLFEQVRAVVAGLPAAMIVIVLLAGPTIAYVLYRVLSATARSRFGDSDAAAPLWICASCRSANDLRANACYSCGAAADVETIEIVSPDPSSGATAPVPMILSGPDPSTRPLVAVGPGRDAGDALAGERQRVAVGPGESAGTAGDAGIAVAVPAATHRRAGNEAEGSRSP